MTNKSYKQYLEDKDTLELLLFVGGFTFHFCKQCERFMPFDTMMHEAMSPARCSHCNDFGHLVSIPEEALRAFVPYVRNMPLKEFLEKLGILEKLGTNSAE